MRKVFTVLAAVLLTATLWAQSPEKMSYQAVIRNSSDALITNTGIAMQISILQGSASGTAVYTETQTPTTNSNGLVSIELGGGTVVSGNFSTINWANGPYFVKIETDPDGATGGISYTITGTSQLLSVPYALYAKTAGSTSGHYVGELYGGGVVFWVDQTGQHGLIVSMVDLSTAQAWSNLSSVLIGITAQSDWNGNSNTTAITGQSGHTSSAAKLCADYTNADYGTGTYSDWYLPSRCELNHLWNNMYEVQKTLDSDGNATTTALVKTFYWTSSELSGTNVWGFYIYSGNTGYNGKNETYYVRAVRTF